MRVKVTRCGSSIVIRSVKRSPRNSMSRSKTVSLRRLVTSQNVMLGTNGSALLAFSTSPSQTSARPRRGSPGTFTGRSWVTKIMMFLPTD